MTPESILRLTWRQLRRIHLRRAQREAAKEAARNSPLGLPGLDGKRAQFFWAYGFKRVLDCEERVIRPYRDDEIEAMWARRLVEYHQRKAEKAERARPKGPKREARAERRRRKLRKGGE